MTPVKTDETNVVIRSASPDVLDLPAYEDEGIIITLWKPSADEMRRLRFGACVQIAQHIGDNKFPPMAVTVSNTSASN